MAPPPLRLLQMVLVETEEGLGFPQKASALMFCKSCGVAGGLVNGVGLEQICRPCRRILEGVRIQSQPALYEALLRQSIEPPQPSLTYGEYLGIGLVAYPVGYYG